MTRTSLLLSRFFWQCVTALVVPNLALALVIAVLMSGEADALRDPKLASLLTACWVGWATVVLAVSYWVARRVTRIAHQVHDSAQAIERGDFSVVVRGLGRDELAQAASAFNDMREELGGQIAELRENRDQLETVLSGMVEGVLAVDAEQRVLLANEACRLLLATSPKSAVGRPLLEVVRNLEVQEAVRKAFRNDTPATRELLVAGASRRVVRILATRLPGIPCPGVVVVLHDVTDLRRLESMRREFVANVSHELKTPLASIRAYAETLRMGAIDDPEHSLLFVQRIEEQAARLDALILDLLHLARVETGNEAFEFSAVSLRLVCQETRQHHSSAAQAAGVQIQVEEPSQDALVWADPEGVRVIVDNLVSNAIKFTPAGGRVSLTWNRNGEMACLTVRDTGIGIAEQDQERVFERFYRVDKARSRELGGTGLGLAIVKHLTLAFDGEVDLTSELGQGSTFLVRLPLAKE